MERLQEFRDRFAAAGEPPEAWDAFERMYRAYRAGASGTVDWASVSPPQPGDVVPLAEFADGPERGEGEVLLERLVWIVLNGGLGTSMKMHRAKSLLPVKDGRSFLDLIVEHVFALRRHHRVDLPVLFMNSFATRDDTLEALGRHGGLAVRGLPLDFVQHRFPRIRRDDGRPYGDPADREAWAPPGHGNLYPALRSSGTLDRLLAAGVRWAFISNADNLGASPHPAILGFLASGERSFLMEVTPKTPADVKGGTLVRRGGRLELLEIAQVPEGREAEFQDRRRFPAFNTNNLWVDLAAVKERLEAGTLDLPLIVNRKEVGGVPVAQLETAMGAAIGAFDRAGGVLVGRDRFAPVKTTDDLLVRRSDVYVPGKRSPLEVNPTRTPGLGPVVVRLDPRYYKGVPDLEARIPEPPSLLEAVGFELVGDVRVGRGVSVRGRVRVENPAPAPLEIPDGTVLSG